MLNRRHVVTCVILFAVMVGGAFWMQPRISVSDSDACAYTEGACSMQDGRGYVDARGYRLNHWPPGYSWLLSLFPDPLRGALVINYLALGVAVAFIYLLTQNAGWRPLASSGAALALGFGFFRSIAIFAKPDILAYALFLVGMRCLGGENNRWRTLGGCLWSALIPVKLMAVVFAPALVLVDCIVLRDSRKSLRPLHCALIVGIWSMAVAVVVGFNYHTMGVALPATHEAGNFRTCVSETVQFCVTFFRSFLANWYGSVWKIRALVPFALTVLSALACLITLRPYPEGKRYAWLGITMLGMTWALEMVRHFSGDSRLTGYGLLLVLLAFRPAASSGKYWLTYAGLTILLTLTNVFTTNSLGVNDPRYAHVAQEFAAAHVSPELLYTNSYRVLDVHARLPSIAVDRLEDVPPGAIFLRIVLPSYDAIQRTTWTIEEPPADWQTIARWKDAILYRRPASTANAGREGAGIAASQPD